MKNPADLTHEQLAEVVTRFVQIFYGIEGPDGSWTHAADKQWCGADICDEVALLLDQFDLAPGGRGGSR